MRGTDEVRLRRRRLCALESTSRNPKIKMSASSAVTNLRIECFGINNFLPDLRDKHSAELNAFRLPRRRRQFVPRTNLPRLNLKSNSHRFNRLGQSIDAD